MTYCPKNGAGLTEKCYLFLGNLALHAQSQPIKKRYSTSNAKMLAVNKYRSKVNDKIAQILFSKFTNIKVIINISTRPQKIQQGSFAAVHTTQQIQLLNGNSRLLFKEFYVYSEYYFYYVKYNDKTFVLMNKVSLHNAIQRKGQ